MNDFIENTGIKRAPLGIMPEYIWVEQRVKEIQDAIQRNNFINCEDEIEEWNRHVNWLMNRKKIR